MKPMPSRRGSRPAFTLVELLVVIAIISLLVALTAAAVFGVFSRGKETTTKIELDQLTAAINLVKQDFGVKYVPSRIVLREDNNYDLTTPNPEHVRTVKFLQQMFPKIDLTPVAKGGKGIDWNGDGKIEPKGDDGKGNWNLYADQSLVFFVGGIPSAASGGCLGFATDPTNPANASDLTAVPPRRKGPYFDFVSSRLQARPNGFFRYLDQWNDPKSPNAMPYLYFSTYGSDNSYHMPPPIGPAGSTGDAPPRVNVLPYFESATPLRFTNPSSFQIISAGKDGVFGPGGAAGPWTPSAGVKGATGQPIDDQANFGGSVLGAPVK